MRISDWSSDVCSSDLALVAATPAWAAPAPDESARLNAFFESVFQRDLQRNPGAQSAMGVKGGQDRWPDVSAARADENVALVRRDLAELRRFDRGARSEEHTSELQSLMRISSAVFCLKTKNH